MSTTSNPRARSLTAVHAAWCVGPRRVALACAEDVRPAACCVVDALVARGYDVVLHTGIDARSALRPAPDDPGRLRVLWIPEHGDRTTKDQLRRALDPSGAGDVLVLASPTPRGVIESIEAFAAGRERPRTRSGPRRTYLEHPTRIESTIELGRIGPAVVGALAATTALLFAVRLSSPEHAVAKAPAGEPSIERTAKPARRRVDQSVLGAAMPALDDLETMSDEPPRRARTRRSTAPRPAAVASAPAPEPVPVTAVAEELAPAPLDEDVPTIVPEPVGPLVAPTVEAVRAVRPPPRIIDPFAP